MCEPITTEDLERRHIGAEAQPTDGPERREKMANGKNGVTVRWIWDNLLRFLIPMIALGVGVLLKNDFDHERRLTAIEASRFTTEDGLQVWREMDRKADRDDVPTPEVLRRLTAIEHELTELRRLLTPR